MERNNKIGTTEERPWGKFTILDEGEGYKVKRIEVFPGKRLSYQKHAKRAEHWFIVAGKATITLDGEMFDLSKGEAIDIAIGVAHRVENTDDSQNCVFIETQTGTYFGEDDIVRFHDDFGR